MSESLLINNVRITFPCLFTPEQFEGTGNPRFSASLLLDPQDDKEAIANIKSAMVEACTETWKGELEVSDISSDKKCLRNGNLKKKWDGYEGMLYLATAAPQNAPPMVLNRDKTPIETDRGEIYGGCYVDVIVEIYGFKKFGNQINASLKAVRFRGAGDSFGAGKADPGAFEDLEPINGDNATVAAFEDAVPDVGDLDNMLS